MLQISKPEDAYSTNGGEGFVSTNGWNPALLMRHICRQLGRINTLSLSLSLSLSLLLIILYIALCAHNSLGFIWPFLPRFSPLTSHNGQVFLGLPDRPIVHKERERWHEKRRGEETEGQRKVVLLCHKFVAMAHEKVELTKFKSLVHMKQYVQQEGFLQSKKKKKKKKHR